MIYHFILMLKSPNIANQHLQVGRDYDLDFRPMLSDTIFIFGHNAMIDRIYYDLDAIEIYGAKPQILCSAYCNAAESDVAGKYIIQREWDNIKNIWDESTLILYESCFD